MQCSNLSSSILWSQEEETEELVLMLSDEQDLSDRTMYFEESEVNESHSSSGFLFNKTDKHQSKDVKMGFRINMTKEREER
jgi:hypothetical protein